MKLRAAIVFGALLGLMLGAAAPGSIPVVEAQSESQPDEWSSRLRIPGIGDEAESPFLVADSNGTVHAFHSQPVPAGGLRWGIVYSKWVPDQGWTYPVDIILPPFGQFALVKGAFLDSRGIIHLIFFGGEDIDAHIFYTWVPAAYADQAQQWSVPEPVGVGARLRTAALGGDDRGNLFVVFTGNSTGTMGLNVVESDDEGQTWSEPSPVQLLFEPGRFPYSVELYVDSGGGVHAVWAVNNAQGAGQAVYYAQRGVDAGTWSQPVLLDQVGWPDYRVGVVTRLGWPSVIQFEDQIIVIYMVCDPCERRMRISSGLGMGWSQPVQPTETTRGEYGIFSFEVDSNQKLHTLFGDRARGLTMWHSIWLGDHWQEPEPVVPVSEWRDYISGPLTFHPWHPSTAVVHGNLLLLVWTQDEGAVDNGTWYSWRTLDAPELAPQPLPTVPATPTSIVQDSNTLPDPTQVPMLGQPDGSAGSVGSPTTPMFLGIVSVILLLAGYITVRRLYSVVKR